MKPEEALRLLDNVTSQISLNRGQHVEIQQAIQALQQAITPKEEKAKS